LSQQHKIYNLIILLLLIVFAFSVASSMRQKSLTSDEPIHLAAGYSYWKMPRDDRLNPEHPPLVKKISALPFVLLYSFDVKNIKGWDEKK